MTRTSPSAFALGLRLMLRSASHPECGSLAKQAGVGVCGRHKIAGSTACFRTCPRSSG